MALMREENEGYAPGACAAKIRARRIRLVMLERAEELYDRLALLSKSLEYSGRIDQHDSPDAYATILDVMRFVRGLPLRLSRRSK